MRRGGNPWSFGTLVGLKTNGGSMRRFLLAGPVVAAALFALPVQGQAQIIQDTTNGAANGAAQGNAAAGPIGGLVGGAVGAGVGAATGAVGTAAGIAGGAVNAAGSVVGGILGADERPRFHEYVESENYPSYRWRHQLR